VSVVPPFDPTADPATYVYVQMARHIEARIKAGELPTGSRLPAERDLCEEYGVSIGTVRRATALLRDRGLVVTVPVKGTFVRAT
jgi:GntR family transcriptional regulator